MRIEEIQVDGFGQLKGTRLRLEGDLVCVLGDNEAGKSTLLGFVRGILFGFNHSLTKEQRDRMGVDGRTTPYDPVEGGHKGGSVVVVTEEQGQEVRYRFSRKEVRRKDGDLTITDLTRNKEHAGEDAERLRDRVLSVDGSLFGTVFAIGLDELHTVKALDKDAVQGVLFAADAGIGADIVHEMDALTKTLEGLHRPRGQKPRINALKRELNEANKTIRAARDEVAAHRGDQDEHERLQKEIREQVAHVDHLLHETERARRRTEARTILHRIDTEQARRVPYAGRVLPTHEDQAAHAALKSRCEAAVEAEQEARDHLATAQAERQRVTFDARAAEAAVHLPAIGPEEVEGLVAAVATERRLRVEQEADRGPHLSPAQRAEVSKLDERVDHLTIRERDVERQVEQAEARRAAAENDALDESTERRLRTLLQEDAAPLEREHERREAAREEARIRAEDALRALGAGWDRARVATAQVDHATEANVLGALVTEGRAATARAVSWPIVAVGLALVALGTLGLAGVLIGPLAGAVLVLAGLVVGGLALAGRTETAGREAAPAEAAKALAAYGLPPTTTRDAFRGFVATLRDARERVDAERRAADAVQQTQQRLERLRQGLQAAAKELGVPTGLDLQEMQREMRRRLDRSQEARSAARAEAAAHAERVRERADVQRALDQVMTERASLLVAAGLEAAASHDLVASACRTSEERDARTQRIEALAGDVERFIRFERGFRKMQAVRGEALPDLDDLPQAFRAARDACLAALAAREEADRMDQELQRAEHDVARAAARAQSSSEELSSFYARFGCTDIDGFHEALADADALAEIDRRIQGQTERLIDLEAVDPELREMVAQVPAEDDARLLANRDQELERLRTHIDGLREQAKRCFARISHVLRQDELTRLIQERDALEKEHDEAVRDWLRLGLTMKLLEKVRERYEREHGPRVLQEASQILAHITEGRYETIGREPDGSYVLTRPDGRRVPAVPPSVSRATFAQVYLAIRLAYAEVHDGNGVPYLLDDVLSDFDDGRLERAVEVLGRLAHRRQVVLFTHHGHVAERLAATGLRVTRLAPDTAVRSMVK